jgi:hypothetical protein
MRPPDKKRFSHGVIPTLELLTRVNEKVDDANRVHPLPYEFAVTGDTSPFGFMLPQLQVREALLPESSQTRKALIDLGTSMRETNHLADSHVPSIYTYFGQFVDHDITLEAKSESVVKVGSKNVRPLTSFEIRTRLLNGRKPGLDLDSVYYKPTPRSRSTMVLGQTTVVTRPGAQPPIKPIPGKDLMNDLPRRPPDSVPRFDRSALIGDERNDENLLIAQLHVAFLRAHNAIVRRGHTFDEARKLLRQHYQWIIVKDFLPRICDPWIVNSIVIGGNRWFRAKPDDLFMPLEFSAAAYRFGHSMVRDRYEVNVNFPTATLTELFELTALSGRLKGAPTLPDNWVLQWQNFVDGGRNRARPIDTCIVRDLFDLRVFGKPMSPEARLPVRNLLRGYMLRLPTGQAVANALKLRMLSAGEIERAAAAVSRLQLKAVQAYGLSARTPLWYYILAEAATIGFNGRLGPVGSTLVAEVLIGLVRGSKDSILREKHWQPSLATTPGKFELSDLLWLAGVL